MSSDDGLSSVSYFTSAEESYRSPTTPKPTSSFVHSKRVTIITNEKSKISGVERGEVGAKAAAHSLASEFRELALRWRKETASLSSTVDKATHPAYQRIIAMGPTVIPLVIEEMEKKGGHWFWALRFLANHDPVAENDLGDIPAMKSAWLAWWQVRRAEMKG